MNQEPKLPPMPEPLATFGGVRSTTFTADQMRTYALAAIELNRAALSQQQEGEVVAEVAYKMEGLELMYAITAKRGLSPHMKLYGAPPAQTTLQAPQSSPVVPDRTAEELRSSIIKSVKTSFALAGQVNDLAMLTRRLIHALNHANPNNAIARKAADYLLRNGLQGSPLRAEDVLRGDAAAPSAPVETKKPTPFKEIGDLLSWAMETAVKNGANSISMPDGYVAIADFICHPQEYGYAASQVETKEQIRNAALEEAAAVCSLIYGGYHEVPDDPVGACYADNGRGCAAAIRSLQSEL